MNIMEFNKLFGAAVGALLIYLLANFVAEGVYDLEEPRELAYGLEIEGAEEDVAEAEEAEPETPFPVLLASADLGAGEKVFKKCAACHKVEDGKNAVGPHLWNVVGRDVGAVGDYRYSGALNEVAQVWTFENLNGFLENPKGWAPGTSMGFAGLSKPEDRAAVIAYLNVEGGSNLPYPEVVEAAPAEAAVVEEAAAADEAVAEDAVAEETTAAPAAAAPAVETEEAAAPVDDATGEQAEAAIEAEEIEVAAAEPAAEAEPVAEEAAAPADAAPADAAPVVADEPAPTGPTLARALARAEIGRGALLYFDSRASHILEDGSQSVAASVYGVVAGKRVDESRAPYSTLIETLGGVWTVEALSAYLLEPARYVDGGDRGVVDLPELQDRADLIAYLNWAAGAPRLPVNEALGPAFVPAPEDVEPAGVEPEASEPEAVEPSVSDRADAAVEATDPETVETAAVVAAPTEEPAAVAAEETAEAADPASEAVEEAAEAVAETGEEAAEVVAETGEAAAAVAEAAEEAAETVVAAVQEEPAAEEAPVEKAPADAAPAAEEVAAAAAAPAAAAPMVDAAFVAAYQAADAKAGAKVFRQCKACHKIEEGKNAVGPSLWQVVGRSIGAVDGFKYSDALASHGGVWDFETLNGYLENPKEYIPGNRMGYRGLKKLEDRAAVIKYLNEEGGSNLPIQ